MNNEPFHTGPFCPVAACAFRSALRAGLIVLAGWLLYVIGERRISRALRIEVRALLRGARDSLFQVLVEAFAHGLAPPPPRRRIHDHRPRDRQRRPTPSHRSAISPRRLLKRALPKAGRTLRARFRSLFLILRRFPRMLARLRRHIFAHAKGAWTVAELAAVLAAGATRTRRREAHGARAPPPASGPQAAHADEDVRAPEPAIPRVPWRAWCFGSPNQEQITERITCVIRSACVHGY